MNPAPPVTNVFIRFPRSLMSSNAPPSLHVSEHSSLAGHGKSSSTWHRRDIGGRIRHAAAEFRLEYGAVTALLLAGPLLIGFLVSLSGTLLCERVARRLQLVAHPSEDRWHRGSVPLLGGVAIMLGVVVVGAAMGVTRFGPLLFLAVAMGGVGLLDDV